MLQESTGENRNGYSRVWLVAFCAALLAGMCESASGATLCVNPSGTSGCYAKIGAAVSAAAANDVIQVARGTYKEDVVIGKALSLVGVNELVTIIDATGLSNGIYIDGNDNSGLKDVLVTGFTVRNANFEGILITNSSAVNIQGNRVFNNDKSFDPKADSCSGLPSFETAEADDCGEGIHLMGVSGSIVEGNIVENNAGGILLTDETAANSGNLITGNVVMNNPYACGITLASHPPASNSGSPLGVSDNTIFLNQSDHNGYQAPGAGAGVGLFSLQAGGAVHNNAVLDNHLTNNGLPGVALHALESGENLDNNVIAANEISGNGADTQEAATLGPTGISVFGVSPITGTVITQNVITDEDVDIAVKTDAEVEAHLNELLGKDSIGFDNLGSGTANVTENWWGCSGGPGAEGCTTVTGSGVVFTPWLRRPPQ